MQLRRIELYRLKLFSRCDAGHLLLFVPGLKPGATNITALQAVFILIQNALQL